MTIDPVSLSVDPASLEEDATFAAVVGAIRQVLHESGREAGTVGPQLLLSADLGLDSLDLAQAVVLLERAIGVDPFRAPVPATGRPAVRTVADLVALYRDAAGEAGRHRPGAGRP